MLTNNYASTDVELSVTLRLRFVFVQMRIQTAVLAYVPIQCNQP